MLAQSSVIFFFAVLSSGEQNTDPQTMDYPHGLPI